MHLEQLGESFFVQLSSSTRQNMAFDEKNSFLTRKPVIFRAFQFFFVSTTVMKVAFYPVYFKQLGIGANYAGILSGAAPFARGFGAPLLGYLADKTNRRKPLFLVSLAAQAVTPILLLIPQPGEQLCKISRASQSRGFGANLNISEISSYQASYNKIRQKVNLTQRTEIGYSEMIELGTSQHFNHDNLENHTGNSNWNNQQATNDERAKEVQTVFIILMAFLTFGEFVRAPARNLADSALLETLGSESSNYGEYRLWGSVGQILLYLTITFTAKYIPLHPTCDVTVQDDYGMAMYVTCLALVIAFVCALQINFNEDCHNEEKILTTFKDSKGSLKDIVLDFRNLTLIIIILYLGAVDGTFFTFMFWYLIDLSPSQATWVIGVAGVARCIISVTVFGLSGKVIRVLGVVNTIHASLIIYVFAFIVYGLITNPWLALVPEVMQAAAFAISMPSCILYFQEKSPPWLSATMQGKYRIMSA